LIYKSFECKQLQGNTAENFECFSLRRRAGIIFPGFSKSDRIQVTIGKITVE